MYLYNTPNGNPAAGLRRCPASNRSVTPTTALSSNSTPLTPVHPPQPAPPGEKHSCSARTHPLPSNSASALQRGRAHTAAVSVAGSMTPTGVINDIRGTGVSRGWRADARRRTTTTGWASDDLSGRSLRHRRVAPPPCGRIGRRMPSGTALSYGLSRFSCHTMIPFPERSPSSTGQLAPRSPSSVRCSPSPAQPSTTPSSVPTAPQTPMPMPRR